MEENRKTLKVYHGIIMLVLSAVCVFFVSPILGAKLGLYGTLLNEILLLVLAVALTAAVRGDFKQVFPIHKPKLSAVLGTILLWIGSFLAIMIITMIIMATIMQMKCSPAGAVRPFINIRKNS